MYVKEQREATVEIEKRVESGIYKEFDKVALSREISHLKSRANRIIAISSLAFLFIIIIIIIIIIYAVALSPVLSLGLVIRIAFAHSLCGKMLPHRSFILDSLKTHPPHAQSNSSVLFRVFLSPPARWGTPPLHFTRCVTVHLCYYCQIRKSSYRECMSSSCITISPLHLRRVYPPIRLIFV